MSKTTPGEFMRQSRAEWAKIVWPTSKETVQTTITVLILTTLLALFFFGVDKAFGAVVSWLTSLAA